MIGEVNMPQELIKTKWVAKDDEDFKYVRNIRNEVFIKEQNVPKELEWDEFDNTAFHLLIFENDIPVATGRLIYSQEKYIPGRIAVLKEHRGKHLGVLLVDMLLQKAFELGAEEVHIHAQIQVKAFYEKIGFVAYGDIFDEAGIPHVSMFIKLRNSNKKNL